MHVNKMTSLTLAAALTLGGAGVAASAFAAAPNPSAPAAEAAPAIPGTTQVAAQNELLGVTAGIVTPVNKLVDAVLEAPRGRLSEAAAERHATAVREAVEKVQQTMAAGGTADRTAAAPEDTPQDLIFRAADQVQQRAEALIETSARTGDKRADKRPANVKKVRAQLKTTVSAASDLLTAVVVSGQLPAPGLEGLSESPTTPEDQNVTPEADAVLLPDLTNIPG